MGKYDNQIEWCQKMIDEERKFMEPLENGTMKHFDMSTGEPVDITETLLQKSRDDVSKLDTLIKAYEKKNAE